MRPSSVSCLFYFCLPPILEEGAEVHGGVLPSFFFCRRDAGGLHLGAGYCSDPTREGAGGTRYCASPFTLHVLDDACPLDGWMSAALL